MMCTSAIHNECYSIWPTKTMIFALKQWTYCIVFYYKDAILCCFPRTHLPLFSFDLFTRSIALHEIFASGFFSCHEAKLIQKWPEKCANKRELMRKCSTVLNDIQMLTTLDEQDDDNFAEWTENSLGFNDIIEKICGFYAHWTKYIHLKRYFRETVRLLLIKSPSQKPPVKRSASGKNSTTPIESKQGGV